MSWLINGQPPEALGVTVAGGEWRTGAASTVRLACNAPADSGAIFAFDSVVSITKDGFPFFTGRCRRVEKSASGREEGHDYVVEDAWAELERTTYQEAWAVGFSGSVLLPQVVLGLNEDGDRITLAQQITAAIAFAAAAGVDIQAGTVPAAGMDLWPSEATGISCAEVIRTCLRYHPDWIPWIDQTTSPPTLNVVAAGTATVRGLALTSLSNLQIASRDDRLPDSVRIIFLTSHIDEEDGEIYRDGTIQKYPLDGPDSGPGVLTTVVELAGSNTGPVAKQQIETRDIPVAGADGFKTAAKAFLKAHFPTIAAIADNKMGVMKWTTAVVADANPKPDPVNEHNPRLDLRDMDDAPRELVDGTVHEWMRKRVGKVKIDFDLMDGPLATAADRAAIRKLPKSLIITGTNARTKIYKGRPQWKTYAEQAPPGVAQACYEAILAGCRYEGSASFIADGLEATGWAGKVLNISGGASAWAGMRAPVHSAVWDMDSDRVSVSFGPNPDLSPQDYADYLRQLRGRPPMWMSPEERTSPTLGDEAGPSAKGEAVGPVRGPVETVIFGEDTQPPFWCEIVLEDAEDPEDPPIAYWTVTPGLVFERQRAVFLANMLYHKPGNILTSGVPTRFAAASGDYIYVKVTEAPPGGSITNVTLITSADDLEAAETASPLQVIFHYKLARVTESAGVWTITPFLTGSHIYHWPEGQGLDLKVWEWEIDTSGTISGPYLQKTHYWRKGWYVGTDDPGTTADEIQDIAVVVDNVTP